MKNLRKKLLLPFLYLNFFVLNSQSNICFDTSDGYDQNSILPMWSYKDYIIPDGYTIEKIYGGFDRPNNSTDEHDFVLQYCPNTNTYDENTAINAWDYGKIDSSLYNKWIDISDLEFKSDGMVRVYLPTKNGAIWNTLCFIITPNLISRNFYFINNYIRIYPNPTKGIINIKFDNPIENIVNEISIFNFSGSEVFKSNTSSRDFQIDISQMANGIYYIRLTNHLGTYYSKCIKK